MHGIWIAAVWSLVLFGFGADFARYLHETPPPPLILHVHGLVAITWLALATTQVFLAERGSIALHRRLGWVTVAVSIALAVLGYVAAMVDMARQIGHPDAAPQFLGEEFLDIAAFMALTGAGVLTRRNRAEHARFMLLGVIAMLDVGLGRISSNILGVTPTGPFGIWLEYYWGTALVLAAMVIADMVRHRCVMRSVVIGGAVLIGGEALASVAYFNPWWQATAASLVKAWNWVG